MTRTTARRRTFGAVATIAALLALAACGGADRGGVASAGGDKKPANADAEDRPRLDDDEQALVFAGCMRDNGVDMPDPGPGREGLADAFQAVSGTYDRSTLAQGFAACEDLMPQYAQEEQHDDETMLALAECLREQGLDVSDNPFEDAHSGEIDQEQFAAAMEVCRDVLIRG